jgi:hypothetical protein
MSLMRVDPHALRGKAKLSTADVPRGCGTLALSPGISVPGQQQPERLIGPP